MKILLKPLSSSYELKNHTQIKQNKTDCIKSNLRNLNLNFSSFQALKFQKLAFTSNSNMLTKSKTNKGASYNPLTKSIDFSVSSKNASRVFLCIFDDPSAKEAKSNIPMEKEGNNWKVSIPLGDKDKGKPIYYGYRAFGPNWEYSDDFFSKDGKISNPHAGFRELLDEEGNRFNPNKIAFDPYSIELSHLPSDNPSGIPAFFSKSSPFEDNSEIAPKSIFTINNEALISKASNRPLTDEIIGEVHIKDLSINENVEGPGTYLGASQMAKKVKNSGITMVEFLPLQEFDNKEGLDGNYWGYMTLGYFAPSKKYAFDKTPGGPIREFREMINAFHKENVKVCMDVVYNHTGEAAIIEGDKENAKLMSFALLDNQMYYKLSDGFYNSNTGCGNDINSGNPEVMELIADSIAFWANQGVDAFRFDLAAGLLDTNEGKDNNYDVKNSIIGKLKEMLKERGVNVNNPKDAKDGIYLIAEPWTCCGDNCYQLGGFPKEWVEWNDVFRETIKRLSLSPFEVTPHQIRNALEGSCNIFKEDDKSVNYTHSHDDFNLIDENTIWKYEGNEKRREMEIKKQIALTLLAKGTPMLQIGDIIGHTKKGNCNSYCNDDDTNYLDFSKIDNEDSFEGRIYSFAKDMINFRKSRDELKSTINNEKIEYFKPDGSKAEDWDCSYWDNSNSNIICYKINSQRPVFISISSDANDFDIILPEPSKGKNWYRICDTSLKNPFKQANSATIDKYNSKAYSLNIFEER